MENNRLEFNSLVSCEYILQGPKDSKEVFLLLHGYFQSGEIAFYEMSPALPKNSLIIAPNGPFPQAKKKSGNWEMGYAWYFFDPESKKYIIDTHLACKFLVNLLLRIGLKEDQELVIIGYSQGGYLAPYVAKELSQTRSVIGVACEFRANRIPVNEFKFRVDQLHGDLDKIVDVNSAESLFNEILPKARSGRFIRVPTMGHEWNDLFTLKLKEIIGGKTIH